MEPLYSKEEIQKAVKRIACQLNIDYEDEKPVIIGVLNGAFIFLADLVREVNFDHQIDFVQIHSYDNNKRGELQLIKKWSLNLFDKSVIIVEDIIDSGKTIQFLKNEISKCFPKDIRVCTLLVRQDSIVEEEPVIDYHGLILKDDSFVVGFGLDNDQFGRGLNCINKI